MRIASVQCPKNNLVYFLSVRLSCNIFFCPPVLSRSQFMQFLFYPSVCPAVYFFLSVRLAVHFLSVYPAVSIFYPSVLSSSLLFVRLSCRFFVASSFRSLPSGNLIFVRLSGSFHISYNQFFIHSLTTLPIFCPFLLLIFLPNFVSTKKEKNKLS